MSIVCGGCKAGSKLLEESKYHDKPRANHWHDGFGAVRAKGGVQLDVDWPVALCLRIIPGQGLAVLRQAEAVTDLDKFLLLHLVERLPAFSARRMKAFAIAVDQSAITTEPPFRDNRYRYAAVVTATDIMLRGWPLRQKMAPVDRNRRPFCLKPA